MLDIFHTDDIRVERCDGTRRNIQQVLDACREERRPYVVLKEQGTRRKEPRHISKNSDSIDINLDSLFLTPESNILVPVTMLEEEVYKAEICTYLARKTGAHLILLRANDYGSKAKQNTQRIITHIQTIAERTGDNITYEERVAKGDSFHIHKELHTYTSLPFREGTGVGSYRIRISSCEPNLLTDEIIDFVAQSKHFAPHFHIPLQSGSNEVLSIMKRRYTRELFAERVQHIREVIPHAFIGVDCMVGVRGETQACWEDYLEFVKRLDVSQLHVFTYSERANTRMLELDLYVVPKAERQRRSKILHAVSEEKTRAFYEKYANRKAVVLWESKKEGDQMSGFTDNYIKVYRPYDKSKVNTFEEV